jgi:peptidoglycan/xylan/chitin deacetylase (PgdA/CDA1 family)
MQPMDIQCISRRKSLQLMGFGVTGLLVIPNTVSRGTNRHIITLSFDDGFEKSSTKTAEIFEKYGLKTCLNIIATANRKDFSLPNEYHAYKVGDFSLWNELASRGHEIMPHGLIHEDYTKLSFDEAIRSISQCLEIFSSELRGFKTEKAIFNFPYNASTPEIEQWLSTRVRAYRTGGDGINPLPSKGQLRLTCISQGPENIDAYLQSVISKFLEGPPAWLIFNCHGLDDEGWGPISSSWLDELLSKLIKMENVAVLNVSQALDLVDTSKHPKEK